MKVKFVGGMVDKISVENNKRVTTKEKATSLTQVFEGMEYHWPEVGAVMSVPQNIGSWLCAKHPGLLVAEDHRGEEKATRIEAVVPKTAPTAAPAAQK